MSYIKLISTFFIAVCLTATALAQSGTLSGRVVGLTLGDIPVVNLLSAKDSAIVKATICDSAGKFQFDHVKDGRYIVSISHVGYTEHTTSVIEIAANNEQAIPDIALQHASTALQTVQVIAKKTFVQKKIDRVVINPDALISNAGTNSLEVLEKAPGVLVDVDGNISLKGKPGVVIFIDNKPTYISGADLAGYLRSLPSSLIEAIEIMTTPPAGYDAAGNAGIINIKLKRNKAKGFNGGINLSYGQGTYMRTNNSINFNYRINKVNLFSNISFTEHNTYQDLTINRYYYNTDGTAKSAFLQNSYLKKSYGGRNARAGFDYYPNKRSTVGMVFAGFSNPLKDWVTNTAKILDNNNAVTNLVEAYSPSDKRWKNGSINLNYGYKIDDKGKELTANADYIHYNSDHVQSLTNSIFTPGHTLIDKTLLASTLPATITIQTLKADYVDPLKDGSKIEAGAKTSFVSTDNTASFFDVVNNISTANYEFSNRFRYKENINAAYFNYSKDWKKISLQLGLRFENTNIDGHQLGNPSVKDSSFTRKYTSLFPTLYINYLLDSMQNNQFGFSFGRRVDRPDYQDLNPFTYPLDRYTYYAGNPFLQPTFSYNFELSHTYKNNFTTTLEYSIANDLIQETNEQRNGIFYSRPGNFGRQKVYGISVSGNVQLTKWWTLQLYSECKNIAFKSVIYDQSLNENKWYWYIGPNNQFTITKKLSAELAGSYQTRILVGQFLTIPVWQMRLGFAQKIFKDKGSIKLNLSDMFYTNQPGGDIRNIANSSANWLSYLDSRVITLSFAYRFNKGKSLNARESGGSETEKGRVKTS